LKFASSLLASSALLLFALPVFGSSTLERMLAEASRDGRYQAPAAGETTRVEAVFVQLLAGTPPAALHEELVALALEVIPVADAPETLLLREAGDARRGRGFYVLRPGVRADVLQVPHAFKDHHTREIGLRLFAEGRFAAAGWNTVPRWSVQEGVRTDADLAHLPDSYFTAFTRAIARHLPTVQVLQIHGFDAGKRKTEHAAAADMIVSNGTSTSSPQLRRQAPCLARSLAISVGVYPDTVRELGGTTNVQGEALRRLGHPGFVHLEMSAALRQRLLDDADSRRAWLYCLQSS